MKLVFFSFGPDNHYAYPEIVSFSENPEEVNILTEDDCKSLYVEADYSVIDYVLDQRDKPKGEDFEDDEEYKDAIDEWHENLVKKTKGEYFYDYGNYNVYEYLFMVLLEPSYSFDDMPSFISIYVDDLIYNTGTVRQELMSIISGKKGVRYILCTHAYPYGNGDTTIAINGRTREIKKSIPLDNLKNSEGDLLKIMSSLVIDSINKGDISLAGSVMSSTNSFMEGIEDYIKTQITEEEYDALKKSYKAHSILGRFK